MHIEYLFEPSYIMCQLDSFPRTKRHIEPIILKASPSQSFPGIKKTSKEIIRVLLNQHNRGPRALMENMEMAFDRGLGLTLYKFSDRQTFSTKVSELFIAVALLNSGFSVKEFDSQRGPLPVPDLWVQGAGGNYVVEVYTPRTWSGFDIFWEDLRNGLKHMDAPFDFRYSMRIEPITRFGHGAIQYLDLEDLSKFFSTHKTRSNEIKRILGSVPLVECDIKHEIKQRNVKVKIALEKVKSCKGNYPNRVATRTWGPDALNPTTMFRKLICRVRDKLNKGQPSFVPGKHYNILLIDISYLGYADAFQNSFYLRQFGKIAQGCLSDRLDLFDCVVFSYNGMQAVGQYPVALVVKKHTFGEKHIFSLFGETGVVYPLCEQVLIHDATTG